MKGNFLTLQYSFQDIHQLLLNLKIKEDKKVKKIVTAVHSVKGEMPNIFKINKLIDIVNNTNENRNPKKDEYNSGL